jgi:PAS domain S-box-containing protein
MNQNTATSTSESNSVRCHHEFGCFVSVLDNLNQAIVVLNRSGDIIYLNKTAELSFFQVVKVENAALPHNISDIMEANERKNFSQNLEKIFYGELITTLIRFGSGNRDDVWFKFYMTPVRDETKKIISAALTINKITAPETREYPNLQSENIDKDSLKEQVELNCSLFPDGIISSVNEAYCGYFGKKENELAGKNFFELIPPKEKEKLLERIKLLSPEFSTYQYTQQITNEGGSIRWLACSDKGIFNEAGELIEIQIAGRDITDQKKLETQLKLTNQKLEAILQVIPDIMFIYDIRATILDCFASSPSQLFLPREAFLGKNADEVFPHHIIGTLKQNIDKCLLSMEPQIQEYQVEIRNETVWFESRYVNAGNNTVLSISRNITARKKIEQELILARDKAEESDRLKTAFLANISHEIRTPMNAILGFTDLMSNSETTSEQINEYASIVRSSSNQLLSIIEDIIDISKIESGQLPVRFGKTELTSLLNRIKVLYSNIASLRNLELRSFPDTNFEKVSIVTDNNLLLQILSNLIGNAIKFTENSKIDFGYQFKGDMVEFFVKDYGEGIPQEYKEIIFEKFRQVESELQIKNSGTGLGLSIAKSLVQSLGGEIWLESQTGYGAQFYFTIPARDIETNANTDNYTPASLPKNIWIDKKILIAEDEDLDYKLMCGLVGTSGINIVRARNGVEALSIVLTDKPDLVLMDLRMPIMNGLSASKAIRKHFPDLPIVALTAYPFSHLKNKYTENDINNYLIKPIDIQSLFSILHTYLTDKN